MAAQLKVVGLNGDNVNTDRQKALEAALAQIDRAFGKGSAMKLGSREKIEIETISTGSLGLDIALGVGGLPRGRAQFFVAGRASRRRSSHCCRAWLNSATSSARNTPIRLFSRRPWAWCQSGARLSASRR